MLDESQIRESVPAPVATGELPRWAEHLKQILADPDFPIPVPAWDKAKFPFARISQRSDLRPAAVLLALVDDSRSLILTRRQDALSAHAGQVAFPGGAVDARDASPEAAALREAREEIGLDPAAVHLLGRLADYPTTSGYRVRPIVGCLIAIPGRLQAVSTAEVAEVFQLPFAVLLDPENWLDHPLVYWGKQIAHRELHYRGKRIWGATAGMLRMLLPALERALRT